MSIYTIDYTTGYDKEGCGRPDCIKCRNSKEAFARIKGWNEAKERAKMPTSTLAEVLKEESLKTVVTQIDGYFDGKIKGLQQEVDKLNLEINSERLRQLREKRNNLNKEIDELRLARDTVQKSMSKLVPAPEPVKRGTFYFLSSRTGDSSGHYIELVGGKASCKTCQSAFYNKGVCWASRKIESANYDRRFYVMTTTPDKFDQMVNQFQKQ